MKPWLERIYNGVVKENPSFVLMLGMCPTLAVTTSATNGLGMGLSTMAVLIVSNLIISLVRKIIPDEIRIPVYIVVIAALVKSIELLIKAYASSIDAALGLFLPLIVVNCIILGRAEAFASKNGVLDSALDGLGMGLGYTCALIVMSLIRQVIATGLINFTNPFTNQLIFEVRLIPESFTISMFGSPTGAFLTFAVLAAALTAYKNAQAAKAAKKEAK